MTTTTSSRQEIGARLQTERVRVGMTQLDLAGAGKVSKNTQSHYESGMRSPDAEYLQLVSQAGVDVLYVVTGKRAAPVDEPIYAQVSRIEALPAHPHVAAPQATYLSDPVPVTTAWLARRGLRLESLGAVRVQGAAMQGVLDDGDLVIIDRSDITPRSGYVYVLQQGDELQARYVQQMPGGALRVSTSNAAYPSYDIDLARHTDVSVLGRVVASTHDW